MRLPSRLRTSCVALRNEECHPDGHELQLNLGVRLIWVALCAPEEAHLWRCVLAISPGNLLVQRSVVGRDAIYLEPLSTPDYRCERCRLP